MSETRLAGNASVKARYFHFAFFLVFAITACVWVATLANASLGGADAYDYAQLSRQISSGQGLTTLQVFPRQIRWLQEHGFDIGTRPAPNFYRYPLAPLLSAAVQTVVPDAERATIIQSGLGFLLSLPMIYLLALRFTSAPLALLCVVVFAAQSVVWVSGQDGNTESLAQLLILVVVFLTFSPETSRMHVFALGAACGLAFLSRSQLFFLVPWSAIFLLLTGALQQRVRLLKFLLAGALVVLAPWFLRNQLEAGSPVFSFFNTRSLLWFTRPETYDIELMLTAPVALGDVLHQYGPVILANIFHNIWPGVFDPMQLAATRFHALLLVVCVLALVFLLRRGKPQAADSFMLFLAGTLLLVLMNFGILCLVGIIPRYVVILGPVLIVAGITSIAVLVREVCPQRHVHSVSVVLVAASLAVGSVLFGIRMTQELKSEVLVSRDREAYELVGALPHRQGAVASDESYKVALYSNRQAVRLPSDPHELVEIHQRYLPIQYVVFSSALLHGGTDSPLYQGYAGFRKSREFAALYGFIRTLPNGAELYGLLDPL